MSAINLPAGVPAYEPIKQTPTSANSIGSSTKDVQDNFMKMLMAQIQNQNPLDPAKPSEFTSQLTQLNTVQGIGDLNASVKSLLGQIQGSDFMGMSQVVGRNALVPGSEFAFYGQPTVLGGELSSNALNVRAVISDANGVTVDEVSLGPVQAGPVRLQWDGLLGDGRMAEPGAYQLKLQAVASEGGQMTVQTFVQSAVASVGREGDAVNMRLADGRVVNARDVLEWLK